jgi:hypothetical protein
MPLAAIRARSGSVCPERRDRIAQQPSGFGVADLSDPRCRGAAGVPGTSRTTSRTVRKNRHASVASSRSCAGRRRLRAESMPGGGSSQARSRGAPQAAGGRATTPCPPPRTAGMTTGGCCSRLTKRTARKPETTAQPGQDSSDCAVGKVPCSQSGSACTQAPRGERSLMCQSTGGMRSQGEPQAGEEQQGARRRSDERRGGGGAQFVGTAAVGAADKRGPQFPECAGLPRPGAARLRCLGEPNGAC